MYILSSDVISQCIGWRYYIEHIFSAETTRTVGKGIVDYMTWMKAQGVDVIFPDSNRDGKYEWQIVFETEEDFLVFKIKFGK